MSKEIRAVIFDLDGTLVDSAPDIADSLNRTLRDQGLGPLDVSDVRKLMGGGALRHIELAYQLLDVQPDDIDKEVERYMAYSAAIPVARSSLYRDASLALRSMRRAGLLLAVCTNKSEPLARKVLDHFRLLELMTVVAGSSQTSTRKPDPQSLLSVIERLGVSVHECLFIGDTVIDRDCAIAAGVDYQIVNWGVGTYVETDRERLNCFKDIMKNSI